MLHFIYYYYFFCFTKAIVLIVLKVLRVLKVLKVMKQQIMEQQVSTGLKVKVIFLIGNIKEPVCNLFYYLHPRIQSCISINYLNVHKVHQNAAKNSNCEKMEGSGSGMEAFLAAIY